MTFPTKPHAKPARAEFSSGPCPKRPGWSFETVAGLAYLGRSHRAAGPKAQIKDVIDRTAAVLGVPEGYRVGIVPASDTGAVEMALWSMLGPRPVDVLVWESFGAGWATDIQKQLKLDDVRVLKADYGQLPDLGSVRKDADVVFTWNGTTSGARERRLDRGRPRGADHLRRHLGGLRAGSGLGQARCCHLLLAEGDGRRGRAWRADPQPPRGGAA